MNPSDQARQVGVVDSWLGQYLVGGYSHDPANNTLITDTGPMAGGYYDVEVGLEVTVAVGLDNGIIEFRNAANTATLFRFFFLTPAAQSELLHFPNVKILANERIRVFVTAAFTGWILAHIRAVKRA